MVVVRALIKAGEGNFDKVLKAVSECVTETRKEDGCICYDHFVSAEDKNLILIFESWESQTHLDAHMKTPHFDKLGKDTNGLTVACDGVKLYDATQK